jgi:hypothetical protein
MNVPSFSFSLKDVADLAARLSVQILSDAGIPASPNPLGFSVSHESVNPIDYMLILLCVVSSRLSPPRQLLE